jgi:hypothetical protein
MTMKARSTWMKNDDDCGATKKHGDVDGLNEDGDDKEKSDKIV